MRQIFTVISAPEATEITAEELRVLLWRNRKDSE